MPAIKMWLERCPCNECASEQCLKSCNKYDKWYAEKRKEERKVLLPDISDQALEDDMSTEMLSRVCP